MRTKNYFLFMSWVKELNLHYLLKILLWMFKCFHAHFQQLEKLVLIKNCLKIMKKQLYYTHTLNISNTLVLTCKLASFSSYCSTFNTMILSYCSTAPCFCSCASFYCFTFWQWSSSLITIFSWRFLCIYFPLSSPSMLQFLLFYNFNIISTVRAILVTENENGGCGWCQCVLCNFFSSFQYLLLKDAYFLYLCF